ncbi:TRAP transporter small permease [Jhaorihella thermophila]|uniref:TRAP transporter small permease protein n=1 Tax=Jhaorihella thermophila TaxID=488547 RepID=A0A1H5UX54_9RHOB|nr:TRAP transporter small permease [Jhaorihella thermophila]SEF79544.1 Tripartite ATP-independent transporter, DctQ component [Jhaorihella thermophila]
MYRFMMRLARFMAALGGAVLTFLILLTCVSIAGRLLNGILHSDAVQSVAPGFANWAIGIGIGPVNGDFELVEAGVAFAIFAFLPLCQITAGHASVDVFASMFPKGVNRFLRMVTEIVFAAVLVLIAVQLAQGMLAKMKHGETSFLLQFPVWWAYGASLLAATVAALVGLYMAAIRTYEFFTRRIVIWDGVEAE